MFRQWCNLVLTSALAAGAVAGEGAEGVWWDGFASVPDGEGVDLHVLALAVHDDQLVAGGHFTHAGDTFVGHVATWDSASWASLDSGTNGSVDVVLSDGTNLYVGGEFTVAGGAPANRVAAWDGTEWSSLGLGLEGGWVNALAKYDGDLVAGGWFQEAGGASIPFLAVWDGEVWAPLGVGPNGKVSALVVHGGDLIAGGFFSSAGGLSVNNIARWDGASWHALSSGVDADVQSLLILNGDVIVGGGFVHAGGWVSGGVARWDGQDWIPLGVGINQRVWALTEYGGNLIIGGSFTTAGGTSANHIVRYQAGQWMTMGAGLGDEAQALIPNQGHLFVGGTFTTAGPQQSTYIARWTGPAELLPDLVGADVVCDPDSTFGAGDSISVAAVVTNTGVEGSGPSFARIEVTGCIGFWGDTLPVAELQPGKSDTVWVGPFARSLEVCEVDVTVDFFDDVVEGDEGNNTVVGATPCAVVGTADVPMAHGSLRLIAPNPYRAGGRLVIRGTGAERLEIYDVAGRLLRFWELDAVDRSIVWDLHDATGRILQPGTYFARLVGSREMDTVTITVLR